MVSEGDAEPTLKNTDVAEAYIFFFNHFPFVRLVPSQASAELAAPPPVHRRVPTPPREPPPKWDPCPPPKAAPLPKFQSPPPPPAVPKAPQPELVDSDSSEAGCFQTVNFWLDLHFFFWAAGRICEQGVLCLGRLVFFSTSMFAVLISTAWAGKMYRRIGAGKIVPYKPKAKSRPKVSGEE